MERRQFAALYAKAQMHRNQLRGNSQLAEFFPQDSRLFPPVLGFGLPHVSFLGVSEWRGVPCRYEVPSPHRCISR
jgi:hypothetical protein